KALADFSRAIELNEKYADAWAMRGALYGKLGQLDRALADLSLALELNRKSVEARINRALVYTRLRQPDRVVADCSRVIELAPPNHPQVVEAYLLRAQASQLLARFAQARADYDKALKRAPMRADVHNALAWL